MADQRTPFKFLSVDSAIILTSLTAFAYISTFLYELGYCQVFNIPKEYISVDINAMLPFWTIIILIFALFLTFHFIAVAIIYKIQKLSYLYSILFFSLFSPYCYFFPYLFYFLSRQLFKQLFWSSCC